MSNGIQHASNLPLASLMKRHLHQGCATVSLTNPYNAGLRRPPLLTGDHEPFCQFLIDFRSRGAFHGYHIDLAQALAGMRHFIDEIPIIGEEH